MHPIRYPKPHISIGMFKKIPIKRALSVQNLRYKASFLFSFQVFLRMFENLEYKYTSLWVKKVLLQKN